MDWFSTLSSGFRVLAERSKEVLYSHQRKYIQSSSQESAELGYVNIRELAEGMCRYDLDDTDLYWLHTLNTELGRMGENNWRRIQADQTGRPVKL